jgi:integrase/recombinase XerD
MTEEVQAAKEGSDVKESVECRAASFDLEKLFATFLKEKQFLTGVAAATLRAYSLSWVAFTRHYGCTHMPPTRESVKALMITMRQSGLSAGTANFHARSINSFLSWLSENGHIPERLRVPMTKQPKQVLKTYSPEEAQRIINHNPKSRTGKRVMTILLLLIDTGARVSEALSLTRKAVDFNNLLITLHGKGNRERRVPISPECRKRLSQWLNTHKHELVFCTEDGGTLHYDNLRHDFLKLLKAVGVEKSEGSFHAFRRFFGKQYLRNGGNPLYLQRVFGHSTLEMTRQYVEADEEDLQVAHRTLSPLETLKAKAMTNGPDMGKPEKKRASKKGSESGKNQV